MTKQKLKNDILKGLLMAAAVAAALPVPHMALAGAASDLAANVTNLQTVELATVPDLIAACFYIGGAGFCGSGLLKLKAHSENPVNTPVGQGVGRLSVGAGLIALPSLATALINTFGMTNAATGYTAFTKVQ
ncbi:MAG: hypothetical protein M3N08_06120 [Pseudomonadota bacterium]|nr:hypothetical protein [Pseudomonadota bacterium]